MVKIVKIVLSVILIALGGYIAYPGIVQPDISLTPVLLFFSILIITVGILNLIGNEKLDKKLVKMPSDEKLAEIIARGKRSFVVKFTLTQLAFYVVLLVGLFPLLSLLDSLEYFEVMKYSALSGAILLPLFLFAIIGYSHYLWRIYSEETGERS